MDDSKNGGGGDELGKFFWGGSKLFSKNTRKYPILACFQRNLAEGRIFLGKKWGGQFFLKKMGGRRLITK